MQKDAKDQETTMAGPIHPHDDEDDIQTAAADGTQLDWNMDAAMPHAFVEDDQIFTGPKIWIVAIPKSGTHAGVPLAASMAQQLGERPWSGNMGGHAFLRGQKPVERVLDVIHQMPVGSWLKGHLAPDPDMVIPQAMFERGISVLHVIRDLRDVAVSQSHHVLAAELQDERLKHPHPDAYRELDTFEDVLCAVIEGQPDPWLEGHVSAVDGPIWTGLVRRWEDYARWLTVPWVYQCPYRHLVDRFEEVAEHWIRYVLARTIETVDPENFRHKYRVSIQRANVDALVQAMRFHFSSKQLSPTFRKGGWGGWREHWTPRVCRAFVEQGGHKWLTALGFEQDDDWIEEWI